MLANIQRQSETIKTCGWTDYSTWESFMFTKNKLWQVSWTDRQVTFADPPTQTCLVNPCAWGVTYFPGEGLKENQDIFWGGAWKYVLSFYILFLCVLFWVIQLYSPYMCLVVCVCVKLWAKKKKRMPRLFPEARMIHRLFGVFFFFFSFIVLSCFFFILF